MAMFPFGQLEKTRDCGYRTLYYVVHTAAETGFLQLKPTTYEEWIDNFRFFCPIKNGIGFNDISTILNYYKIDRCFTQVRELGLQIIYSGSWLKHGHYFVYHDGIVLCSTKTEPEKMPLEQVLAKLEVAKSIDGAFRCLRITGPLKEEAPLTGSTT